MLRQQYHYRDVFSGWVDLAYDTITYSEVLTSIWNICSLSGTVNTGAIFFFSFSFSNTSCSFISYLHSLFLVNSVRGFVIWTNPLIKHL